MDEKAFCYWLKGFVELGNSEEISPIQWEVIKDHLNLVFNKQTPYRVPSVVGPTLVPPNFPAFGPGVITC